MRTLVGAAVLAFGVAAGTGCSARYVYYSPYEENYVTIPVEQLAQVARDTVNTLVTEGEPWMTQYDTGSSMRVTNAHGNSHQTIVDLTFMAQGPDESAFKLAGYSQARASWVTGGITSTATQTIAKRKADELRREIYLRSGQAP